MHPTKKHFQPTFMFENTKKTICTLGIAFLLALLSLAVSAQKMHALVYAGIANYQGDLQPTRITLKHAKPAVGVALLYELGEKFYLRGGFNYLQVAAADSSSSINKDRNLSFATSIAEVNLLLEYDLLNSYERSLVPFVFAGGAWYSYNPYTKDRTGKKVYLQPLGTEGQGFFNGRTPYNLQGLAAIFGGGLKLAVSENVKLRFEAGIRFLGTDYLDDVSTTYPDGPGLLLNNGPVAFDLSFRSDEIKPITGFPSGAKRGNPGSNDVYYTAGASISFRLGSAGEGTGSFHGSKQYGCPKF
jgi:Domain of unknown function (DUF6089)